MEQQIYLIQREGNEYVALAKAPKHHKKAIQALMAVGFIPVDAEEYRKAQKYLASKEG